MCSPSVIGIPMRFFGQLCLNTTGFPFLIHIPEYVVEIDDLAFEDCQLTTLTISNPIPATCTDDAFKGVNPVTLVIKVPKGCYESFWVHPVFGKFKIEEMDE